MTRLIEQATDPRQYDGPALDWLLVGRRGSASGGFFENALEPALGDLSGLSLLEIGSGTGRLFGLFKRLGAKRLEGIEPSKKNAAVSLEEHPDVPVFAGPFEAFSARQHFDRVVAVMVFEHIENLGDAFSRIHRLLKPGGGFFLIVGDPECQTHPALYEKIDIEELGGGARAVRTVRPFGVLVNIVRPLDSIREAAARNGLKPAASTPLASTPELMARHPNLQALGGKPLCHLLAFARQASAA